MSALQVLGLVDDLGLGAEACPLPVGDVNEVARGPGDALGEVADRDPVARLGGRESGLEFGSGRFGLELGGDSDDGKLMREMDWAPTATMPPSVFTSAYDSEFQRV